MVKAHEASFPAWSLNLYVTVVSPGGKVDPEACVLTIVTGPPESSVAVGSVHDTSVWLPIGAVTCKLVGQFMIVGGVPSASVVIKLIINWQSLVYTMKIISSLNKIYWL